MKGSIFRRCGRCTRRAGQRRCEHCEYDGVTWTFVVDVGNRADGSRRQLRRGGFETKREAEEALTELLAEKNRSGFVPTTDLSTGDYLLERWLPRTKTRPSTYDERRVHLTAYVVPRIGGVPLTEVSGDDLTEMYDDLLASGRTRRPHPELGWGLSPTTVRHVHTILHKAFADAIRWGLLARNPCDQADPPSTSAVRARAQAARAVWSWDQLRQFVTSVRDHRLYAMWHLFATTGMRRGEMAALLWRYMDLEEGLISIVRNAVPVRGEVIEQDYPKSASSRRAIELDELDISILREHRRRQAEERLASGGAWSDVERVFTTTVGGRLYPPDITKTFHELTDDAGVPRIRVQDLRHTHATLLLKSNENIKVISERLGHSTTSFTMDTYASFIPGMQRDAARRFSQRLLRDGDRGDESPNGDPAEDQNPT